MKRGKIDLLLLRSSTSSFTNFSMPIKEIMWVMWNHRENSIKKRWEKPFRWVKLLCAKFKTFRFKRGSIPVKSIRRLLLKLSLSRRINGVKFSSLLILPLRAWDLETHKMISMHSYIYILERERKQEREREEHIKKIGRQIKLTRVKDRALVTLAVWTSLWGLIF